MHVGIPTSLAGKQKAMKILFTADLHLNILARSPRTGRTSFDVFAEVVEWENPDAVVVAGDIGTPAQSARDHQPERRS